MLELTVLSLSSCTNIFLGLLVYLKDIKNPTNRVFGLLNGVLVILSVSSYLSLHSHDPLLYMRLVMVFAAVMALLFKWLSVWFPSSYQGFPSQRRREIWATILACVVVVTPITFSGASMSASGSVQPEFEPGIVIFIIFFLYMTVSGLVALVKRLRRSQAIERAQLYYLLIAIITLIGLVFISNLILPLVSGLSEGVALTPIYFSIFAAIIAVAIVRRRLFDIKAVVAKSVAYALLLISLVIIYAVLVFGLSTLFFSDKSISFGYRVSNVIVAVILAFSFPFLKRFFDRITSRLFYQDRYDPQILLNMLNRILVGSVSLSELLNKSTKLVGDTLEVRFCAVLLQSDGPARLRLASTAPNLPVAKPTLEHTMNSVADLDKLPPVVTADSLLADDDLKQLLEGAGIAVLARLNGPQRNQSDLGYIILGDKKNGGAFSSSDSDTIEIIANSLSIATQSALRFEEIQAFNETLQEKVKGATAEIRRSNDKLKRLDETKDDFISMASHQLRTPLTSVKGYLSMVLEGDAGKISAAQRKMLSQAMVSSQRMVFLIADLLNVSRLKTGKFTITTSPTDVAVLISEEIDQLQDMANSRTISITYKQPENFPKLMLDETKTRQVIMNFIDNAIFYTDVGGRIEVNLTDTGEAIELRVVDNGIGVPASERHQLFTKFYRAENAKRARPDGTGIGLFMAKKVVVAEGGAIIFDSKEGEGSTFGFSFPKKKLEVATSTSLPTASTA